MASSPSWQQDPVGSKTQKDLLLQILHLSEETDHNRVLQDIRYCCSNWWLDLELRKKGPYIPHALKQRRKNLGMGTPAYRMH